MSGLPALANPKVAIQVLMLTGMVIHHSRQLKHKGM
jgi:hypothetical protein